MDKEKQEKTIKKIEEILSKLNTKEENIYFFVLDTKGNPNSLTEYEYNVAYSLHEKGYKVTMLHQEEEFVGVTDWMGEKYGELTHKNVEKENVEISPCDFLFIPEVYANVMAQTKNLPCTRIAIFHDSRYLTEFIPVGATWNDFNIFDAITTTEHMKNKIEGYFPNVKAHIVRPLINECFRDSDEPKKLIVNVVTKDQSKVNQIIKTFYWLFPVYKWISFRDVRGLKQDVFADALREAAITIWDDSETDFGYSGIDALKSGSLLIAKLPETPTEWMMDDKGEIRNDILWYDTIDNLPPMLASVIRAWTKDEIPDNFTKASETVKDLYTKELHDADIEDTFENTFVDTIKKNYGQILVSMKNKLEEKEKNDNE